MEAIIAAVVGGLMNCLCSSNNGTTRSVFEPCNFILNPTKEIISLRKKIADLNGQADDVFKILDIAESEEGKIPTNVVKSWLNDVENVNIEMKAIEDKIQKANKCLKGLLPDCGSRSDLGRCISKLLTEVTPLLEKGGHFLDNPSSLALQVLNKGIRIPTTRLVGKITAEKNMMNVWERLLHPSVGIIGLYGMGGAGKTTIMKEVNNQLVKEAYFDIAIWVTVSKDASVHKLQSHIAAAVNIKLSEDYDEIHRSALLLNSLERKKKFILILDDMWEVFPIHMIGIPEPSEANGCKIIFTSRSKEVCRGMGCHVDNIIKVKLLSEAEAWELFMHKVGIHLTPKVTEIAKNVVKECACLPLAIITIGGVMKGHDDISEWRVALRHLKESMEDDVFKCLRFSYERLVDEKLKCCFLYCALYPEDHLIETSDLVDYWIAEGLIQGNPRQYELDQGQVILNKLRDRCLLESVSTERVKLHDLLREMALNIAKHRFHVKAGSMLKEIQNEEEWGEDLERASFIKSDDVTKISVTPKCPKLSTLFLNNMNNLNIMPSDFFVHMKGLKVLNLEGSWRIARLPSSISDLENLRALCLTRSKIRKVPSLAKLTLLRTLKLNDSGINELPHGMEMLVNLKCLALRGLRLRGKFPIGLIPKWPLLEELSLLFKIDSRGGGFHEVEGDSGLEEELLSLKHLEVLTFKFISLSHFNSYVGSPAFEGLKMFELMIIGARIYPDRSSFKPAVAISKTDSPVSALIIPQNTKTLELREFKNLMSLNELSTRLNQLGCLELRICGIEECQNMEYALWFSQEEEKGDEDAGVVLPCMEMLGIYSCSKLESLCKGIPTRGTLLYLKELHIEDCHKMKNVFSSSRLLQLLQHLEEIDVRNCEQMEEFIASSSSEEAEEITSTITISFPKLKIMNFVMLQKLKSIWKGGMVCHYLEVIEILECGELKKLPQLSAPSLQEIRGDSQQWWDSLEWDDGDEDHPSLGQTLQPLFRLND